MLRADSLSNGGVSLSVQGGSAVANGAVFGDGLRCASSPIVRLRVKANPNGASHAADVGDPPLLIIGEVVPGSSTVQSYQVWFRAANAFCTSATFNLTNALRVGW